MSEFTSSSQSGAKRTFRGAVIGYGGAFNMGKGHLSQMQEAGIIPAAACDVDASRMDAAKTDFPDIRTYTSPDQLLADKQVDLVAIITPHNTHAELAIQAAKAGKHVVVEKPMCISSAEATAMIDAAKAYGVSLSVFHNRRYDGDFVKIKQLIDDGYIGDVFQIQAGFAGYSHPGTWWRSNKEISGGIMYDWGAHFIDWILHFMAGRKVTQVTGFLQKKVWMDQTNEDHGQIVMRFDNGAAAELTQSNIAMLPMPKWRIQGTKGGILDDYTVRDGFKLFTLVGEHKSVAEIRNPQSAWNKYYVEWAAHLEKGNPLPVTAESSRRIIAIIEAAERSSKSGHSEPVAHE